ncbi:protease FtsH-inhibitory lysogeny factor CIII [Pantoea septica]|nr:protease FtsH-inhibitory lysogeny factor CIII [Pantoea septica]
MIFSIAGGPIVDFAYQESLLDVITRRLRAGLRSVIDTLNQRGQP